MPVHQGKWNTTKSLFECLQFKSRFSYKITIITMKHEIVQPHLSLIVFGIYLCNFTRASNYIKYLSKIFIAKFFMHETNSLTC